MNGVMNKMAKVTGLRLVKSAEQKVDHAQDKNKYQNKPKNVINVEKDSQQTNTWKPFKTQYRGDGKWRNINPNNEIAAMFDQRKVNHENSKRKKDYHSPSITAAHQGKHNFKDPVKTRVKVTEKADINEQTSKIVKVKINSCKVSLAPIKSSESDPAQVGNEEGSE